MLAELVLIALALWGYINPVSITVVEGSATPESTVGTVAAQAQPGDTCVITVFPPALTGTPDFLLQVIEHEVGHCLGLNHIEEAGIMNAVMNRDDVIQLTYYDRLEYRRHYPAPYRLALPFWSISGCDI